jgi:hypothetical protein
VYIGEYNNTTKKFHILEYETRDLTNLGDNPAKYDIDFTTIVPRDKYKCFIVIQEKDNSVMALSDATQVLIENASNIWAGPSKISSGVSIRYIGKGPIADMSNLLEPTHETESNSEEEYEDDFETDSDTDNQ